MSVGISREDQGLNCGELAGFFGHKNVAALIRSALPARNVRQLTLMAVWALGEAGGGQKIVAAALGSPLLRVAPFWIRHCSIPFNRPRRLREETRGRRGKNLILVLQLELVRQTRKRIPSRIGRGLIAGTFRLIQILTTARAKPFTVRHTESATRQGE
jgi:hypothetical protein